jgi:hypothetical protein
MKQARLLWITLAILLAGSATLANACDKDHSTQASATAAATGSGSCPHGALPGVKASSAVVASMDGTGHCAAAHGAAAVSCEGKAGAASASDPSCGGKNAAVTASSSSSCSAKGAGASAACRKSTPAASASACIGHGMATVAARSTHEDCDACVDMSDCETALESAGANTQVVALKNGVMYVFTADTPVNVHAVQAAMARRSEHWTQIAAAGGKAHLCGSCKEMRGAAASGKLAREFVNIEGGCLTLITSNDPAVVAKIQAMAGIGTIAAKVKS